MSARTTAATTPAPVDDATVRPPARTERPGLPFPRLVRLELRKLVDTRSGRWMLAAVVVVTALAMGLTAMLASGEALTFGTFLAASSTPQMVLLPILGILSVTSEIGQRTALVTFTQEPRRAVVVLAKLAAVTIMGLAAIAVSLALAAGATLLAQAFADAPTGWQVSRAALGGSVLAELLSVWQGLAFGLVLSSAAWAIVAYFVVPMLLPLLGLVSWLRPAAPWLDPSPATVLLLAGRMNPTHWAHLGSAHAVWTLVPLLVGTWMLLRRELK